MAALSKEYIQKLIKEEYDGSLGSGISASRVYLGGYASRLRNLPRANHTWDSLKMEKYWYMGWDDADGDLDAESHD
jgi:hypothetical protein